MVSAPVKLPDSGATAMRAFHALLRLCAVLLLAALSWGLPTAASAQGIESVLAPGKLITGHAKAEATAPVAVGFGIGTPEQAAQVGEVADGVIIGSRLVRAVGEASDTAAAVEAVSGFLSQARRALEGDRPA